MAIEIKTVSDSSAALKDLARLNRSLDGVSASSAVTSANLDKISGTKSVGTFRSVNKEAKKASDSVSTLSDNYKGLLKTLVSAAAVTGAALAFTKISDSISSMNNRLRVATDSVNDYKEALRGVRGAAIATGTPLSGIANIYSKVAIAGKRFNVTQQQTAKFTNNVAKALAVSGASAQEANSVIIQLGQGLGSNRLAGEELRAVLEGSQYLAIQIAKGIGIPFDELRAKAEAGELTYTKVVNSILKQNDEIRKDFDKVTFTFSRSLKNLGTALSTLFAELSVSISGDSGGIAGSINNLANNIFNSVERINTRVRRLVISIQLSFYKLRFFLADLAGIKYTFGAFDGLVNTLRKAKDGLDGFFFSVKKGNPIAAKDNITKFLSNLKGSIVELINVTKPDAIINSLADLNQLIGGSPDVSYFLRIIDSAEDLTDFIDGITNHPFFKGKLDNNILKNFFISVGEEAGFEKLPQLLRKRIQDMYSELVSLNFESTDDASKWLEDQFDNLINDLGIDKIGTKNKEVSDAIKGVFKVIQDGVKQGYSAISAASETPTKDLLQEIANRYNVDIEQLGVVKDLIEKDALAKKTIEFALSKRGGEFNKFAANTTNELAVVFEEGEKKLNNVVANNLGIDVTKVSTSLQDNLAAIYESTSVKLVDAIRGTTSTIETAFANSINTSAIEAIVGNLFTGITSKAEDTGATVARVIEGLKEFASNRNISFDTLKEAIADAKVFNNLLITLSKNASFDKTSATGEKALNVLNALDVVLNRVDATTKLTSEEINDLIVDGMIGTLPNFLEAINTYKKNMSSAIRLESLFGKKAGDRLAGLGNNIALLETYSEKTQSVLNSLFPDFQKKDADDFLNLWKDTRRALLREREAITGDLSTVEVTTLDIVSRIYKDLEGNSILDKLYALSNLQGKAEEFRQAVKKDFSQNPFEIGTIGVSLVAQGARDFELILEGANDNLGKAQRRIKNLQVGLINDLIYSTGLASKNIADITDDEISKLEKAYAALTGQEIDIQINADSIEKALKEISGLTKSTFSVIPEFLKSIFDNSIAKDFTDSFVGAFKFLGNAISGVKGIFDSFSFSINAFYDKTLFAELADQLDYVGNTISFIASGNIDKFTGFQILADNASNAATTIIKIFEDLFDFDIDTSKLFKSFDEIKSSIKSAADSIAKSLKSIDKLGDAIGESFSELFSILVDNSNFSALVSNIKDAGLYLASLSKEFSVSDIVQSFVDFYAGIVKGFKDGLLEALDESLTSEWGRRISQFFGLKNLERGALSGDFLDGVKIDFSAIEEGFAGVGPQRYQRFRPLFADQFYALPDSFRENLKESVLAAFAAALTLGLSFSSVTSATIGAFKKLFALAAAAAFVNNDVAEGLTTLIGRSFSSVFTLLKEFFLEMPITLGALLALRIGLAFEDVRKGFVNILKGFAKLPFTLGSIFTERTQRNINNRQFARINAQIAAGGATPDLLAARSIAESEQNRLNDIRAKRRDAIFGTVGGIGSAAGFAGGVLLGQSEALANKFRDLGRLSGFVGKELEDMVLSATTALTIVLPTILSSLGSALTVGIAAVSAAVLFPALSVVAGVFTTLSLIIVPVVAGLSFFEASMRPGGLTNKALEAFSDGVLAVVGIFQLAYSNISTLGFDGLYNAFKEVINIPLDDHLENISDMFENLGNTIDDIQRDLDYAGSALADTFRFIVTAVESFVLPLAAAALYLKFLGGKTLSGGIANFGKAVGKTTTSITRMFKQVEKTTKQQAFLDRKNFQDRKALQDRAAARQISAARRSINASIAGIQILRPNANANDITRNARLGNVTQYGANLQNLMSNIRQQYQTIDRLAANRASAAHMLNRLQQREIAARNVYARQLEANNATIANLVGKGRAIGGTVGGAVGTGLVFTEAFTNLSSNIADVFDWSMIGTQVALGMLAIGLFNGIGTIIGGVIGGFIGKIITGGFKPMLSILTRMLSVLLAPTWVKILIAGIVAAITLFTNKGIKEGLKGAYAPSTFGTLNNLNAIGANYSERADVNIDTIKNADYGTLGGWVEGITASIKLVVDTFVTGITAILNVFGLLGRTLGSFANTVVETGKAIWKYLTETFPQALSESAAQAEESARESAIGISKWLEDTFGIGSPKGERYDGVYRGEDNGLGGFTTKGGSISDKFNSAVSNQVSVVENNTLAVKELSSSIKKAPEKFTFENIRNTDLTGLGSIQEKFIQTISAIGNEITLLEARKASLEKDGKLDTPVAKRNLSRIEEGIKADIDELNAAIATAYEQSLKPGIFEPQGKKAISIIEKAQNTIDDILFIISTSGDNVGSELISYISKIFGDITDSLFSGSDEIFKVGGKLPETAKGWADSFNNVINNTVGKSIKPLQTALIANLSGDEFKQLQGYLETINDYTDQINKAGLDSYTKNLAKNSRAVEIQELQDFLKSAKDRISKTLGKDLFGGSTDVEKVSEKLQRLQSVFPDLGITLEDFLKVPDKAIRQIVAKADAYGKTLEDISEKEFSGYISNVIAQKQRERVRKEVTYAVEEIINAAREPFDNLSGKLARAGVGSISSRDFSVFESDTKAKLEKYADIINNTYRDLDLGKIEESGKAAARAQITTSERAIRNILDKYSSDKAAEAGEQLTDNIKSTFIESFKSLVTGEDTDFIKNIANAYTENIMNAFVQGLADSLFDPEGFISEMLNTMGVNAYNQGAALGKGEVDGMFAVSVNTFQMAVNTFAAMFPNASGIRVSALARDPSKVGINSITSDAEDPANMIEDGMLDNVEATENQTRTLETIFKDAFTGLGDILSGLFNSIFSLFRANTASSGGSDLLGSILKIGSSFFSGSSGVVNAGPLGGSMIAGSNPLVFMPAEGGFISGPGTSRSDSIPAMLSNGEFVMNAKATSQFRPLLERLNGRKFAKVKKYASGGFVGKYDPSTGMMSDSSPTNDKGQQVFNINITGDISRQTKQEIYRMIPEIAAGVGRQNLERR
jgi:tape measure domain-containing protein